MRGVEGSKFFYKKKKRVFRRESCFLSPEQSSCRHHWLKQNSVFKCDSFPQAFHKLQAVRFEGACELFLPGSGSPYSLLEEKKKKKKTVQNPEGFSPGHELAPSCLPMSTPTSMLAASLGGPEAKTLFSSLSFLLSPPGPASE